MESSTPEPEPSGLGSSERSPEVSESSDTDRTSPELSGLVVLGTLANGAFETCDEVVDGSVVDVEVLVVGAELVDEVTATGAGSSTGTGFCQTERDVGAPMLGNSVSRIAYAVPADPMTAATATIATTARLDRDRHTPELWPSATSISGADLTGLRESPSPCPWSSQFSLTGHTLHAERSEHHRTLVVVPGSGAAVRSFGAQIGRVPGGLRGRGEPKGLGRTYGCLTTSTEISTAGIAPLFSSQCKVSLSSGQPSPGP